MLGSELRSAIVVDRLASVGLGLAHAGRRRSGGGERRREEKAPRSPALARDAFDEALRGAKVDGVVFGGIVRGDHAGDVHHDVARREREIGAVEKGEVALEPFDFAGKRRGFFRIAHERDDVVSAGHEPPTQMTSDEPGSPREQHFHCLRLLLTLVQFTIDQCSI